MNRDDLLKEMTLKGKQLKAIFSINAIFYSTTILCNVEESLWQYSRQMFFDRHATSLHKRSVTRLSFA